MEKFVGNIQIFSTIVIINYGSSEYEYEVTRGVATEAQDMLNKRWPKGKVANYIKRMAFGVKCVYSKKEEKPKVVQLSLF